MKLIKKDIIAETEGFILQGCNASGGYGAGLSGHIAKKWPQVYEQFKAQGTGKHLLGTIDIIKINNILWIVNGYTQLFYGNDGKKYADVTSVDLVLHKAFIWCYLNNVKLKTVQLGCGLGGLDWTSEVQPLFEKYEKKIGIEAEIYYI